MKASRWVVYNAIFAALYVVLTVAIAPFSYGPIQLRISECLKSIVIWHPFLIPSFVIGNALSNLASPFVGVWELLWMPFANLVGAWLCARLGKLNKWVAASIYAIVIGVAVSLMLSALLGQALLLLLPSLLLSELIVILGGVPIMGQISNFIHGED